MKCTIQAAVLMTLALTVSGVALSDSLSNNSEDTSSNDVFNKLDSNRDGSLSQREANDRNQFGTTKFSAMDIDKDGKISLSEYQNYMHSNNGKGTNGAGNSTNPNSGSSGGATKDNGTMNRGSPDSNGSGSGMGGSGAGGSGQ